LTTGVPKLAASMIPLELFPTSTAASRSSPRNTSRGRSGWTLTAAPPSKPTAGPWAFHASMIPAAPGSLFGPMITTRSIPARRVAVSTL
jgi:hypothetical protein